MKSLVRIVALLVVVGLAIPAMAKPVSKSITLGKNARFGTTEVTAGDYTLLIDNTQITVKQGRKVIAEVEGRWEQREEKSRFNAVLIGENGQVKEVRFAGDKRVLVVNP